MVDDTHIDILKARCIWRYPQPYGHKESEIMSSYSSSARNFRLTGPLFLVGGCGSFKLHLMMPNAEIAPTIVVVFGTVTTAGVPFLDHAMLHFMLIWNSDSSKKNAVFEADVGPIPSAYSVKALLDLRRTLPVYRLKPNHF